MFFYINVISRDICVWVYVFLEFGYKRLVEIYYFVVGFVFGIKIGVVFFVVYRKSCKIVF